MRKLLLPAMLITTALCGCATGYATDWFRDRTSIINPQLIRYGMDIEQSRCVGQRLGASLSRLELRQFQESAAAVQPAEGAALTLAHLRAVATGTQNAKVRTELDASVEACNVPATPVLAAAAPVPAQPTASAAAPANTGATSGGVAVDMTPLPLPGTTAGAPAAGAGTGVSTWLNLGAAESGQSIAIDAVSIQQEGATRTAWFRMTDESGAPTNNHYRLKIDCEGRTVQPLALRQMDAAGAQVSLREYTPAEATPGAAEAGTVLEIAFLSLCT